MFRYNYVVAYKVMDIKLCSLIWYSYLWPFEMFRAGFVVIPSQPPLVRTFKVFSYKPIIVTEELSNIQWFPLFFIMQNLSALFNTALEIYTDFYINVCHKYMLFTGREGRIGKLNCALCLEYGPIFKR